jgi:hypothetical protein
MKYNFKILFALLFAAILSGCVDDDPTPFEEMTTSATSFPSTVFAVELTSVKTHPDNPLPEPIEIFLGGSGKISVNWGDGTIEKLTLGSIATGLKHQYDRVKNYTIQITGSISTLSEFRCNYQHVNLRKVHLSGLTGLKTFSVGSNYLGPEAINFSHNRQLADLSLMIPQLSDVILPTTNQINRLSLAGPNRLSTAVVDRVISRVYDSVKANPRAGVIELSADAFGDPEDHAMIGPPSSFSINKLKILKNNYGWTVVPDVQ